MHSIKKCIPSAAGQCPAHSEKLVEGIDIGILIGLSRLKDANKISPDKKIEESREVQ